MMYAPAPPTSGLAVAALVTGLLAIFAIFMFIFGAILGVGAVILGALGIRECRDGARGGSGMAVAGLVLGIVALVPSLLFLMFFGFLLGW